jgi:hypothetical protein
LPRLAAKTPDTRENPLLKSTEFDAGRKLCPQETKTRQLFEISGRFRPNLKKILYKPNKLMINMIFPKKPQWT